MAFIDVIIINTENRRLAQTIRDLLEIQINKIWYTHERVSEIDSETVNLVDGTIRNRLEYMTELSQELDKLNADNAALDPILA